MSSRPDEVAVAQQTETLEELVRNQLSKALGGRRGIVEGAVPTLGFTISWVVSHDLHVALAVSLGLALALLVARLVQRSNVQFVLNSLVGITIAAFFALRSGKAEDAFLPGILYNGAYAVLFLVSVLVRWPLVGFAVGGVMGDLIGWRRDRRLVALCSKLTLLLALPCILRVLVQYPLYASHHAGWLGVAKIAMGWPLQLAALFAMVWVLRRDSTQVPIPPDVDPDPDPA